MSLRLAALDALIVLKQLYAPGWGEYWRVRDNFDDAWEAMKELRQAVGINPPSSDCDNDLTEIGLLNLLAESLARRPETEALAAEINAALGAHNIGVVNAALDERVK
jgi:hypothetical protein